MNLKVNIVFISSLISALLSACTGGNNVDRNTNEEELESQQQSISQQQIYSVLDSLELVDYETGYYEYININSNILLYQPQIILKFKNKSSIPIKGNVEISAIFIKGDEEWSNESSYFQSKYTDEPLQPGLARQTALQSSVGWTNFMAIRNSNVSVRILMNGILYKTFPIDNILMTSNRINENKKPPKRPQSDLPITTLETMPHTATINDPDGYTNIRASNNVKSEIVGKILEGEVFTYWETNDNWYKVETTKGAKGYVHKSRIKPIDNK